MEDIFCRKERNRSIDYRRILDHIYSVDATNNLLLEGFFLNYKNSKAIYRNSSRLPRLLDDICHSDRIINTAFEYNYELNVFLPVLLYLIRDAICILQGQLPQRIVYEDRIPV
jgi:hypothetical protein